MIGAKRKIPWLLIAGMMAGSLLQIIPAHAAGGVSGTDLGTLNPYGGVLVPPSPAVPTTGTDAGCGDALDPIATQSRLAHVYQPRQIATGANPTYTNVLDISKYRFYAGKKLDGVNADPGFINAMVELCGPAPSQVTDIPPGYSDITYYWVFQNIEPTGPQLQTQIIGQDCDPTRNNDLGPTSDQRISLFRYRNAGLFCPKALSAANELNQIATGTSAVNEIDVIDSGAYVNRPDDHWYEQINVSFAPELVGVQAKLVGRWTYGVFEEFSQIYTSIDPVINTQQLPATPNASAYVKTGSACSTATGTGTPWAGVNFSRMICVKIPYAPRLDNASDDDRLVDESRTNPLIRTGDDLLFYAVTAFGTRQAGLPFPVCPFSPTYPNPQGNPVPLPGYPQTAPGADGGRFCRQGFVGLLSGHDWVPNTGFEGRAVPRSPSWLPGTTTNAAMCQYPVGSQTFGITAAPITPTMVGSSNEQDNAVFYDQEKYWISPSYQNGPSLTPEVEVPAQTFPKNGIPALTGQNLSCGYQLLSTGLHYKSPSSVFFG